MSNFNWYNNVQSQQPSQPIMQQQFDEPRQFDQPPQFQPQYDQRFDQPRYEEHPPRFDSLQQPVIISQPLHGSSSSQPGHDFVLPHPEGSGNVYIHADNVIIQNGPEHSGEGPVPVIHHNDKQDMSKTTTTTKDASTGDKIKSTTVTDKKANDSLAPPTHGNPGDKTIPPLSSNNAHSSTLPISDIPPATNSGAPGHNAVATNANAATAPVAVTTTTPAVVPGGPVPPATTTTTTSDPNLPAHTSANEHPPVGKSQKKHKTIKERYVGLKAKLHGGGSSISGDVHPKDSRDGKTLPSQNELSQRSVTEPHGNSAEHPVIHKDANDATGKTITGSDANPSKASMPFKTPTPSLHQAPIDAKSQ